MSYKYLSILIVITHKLRILNLIFIYWQNTQKNILFPKMKLKLYVVFQKRKILKMNNDGKYLKIQFKNVVL